MSSTLLTFLFIRYIRKKRKRTMYVRNIFRNRNIQGEMQLVRELNDDTYYHHRYFRMSKENFNYILGRISHRIRHDKSHAFPISEQMRLAITLRYLAAGPSQISLAMSFRISLSSVSLILTETLSALWEELVDEYMPIPDPNGLLKIAEQFYDLWNFPHCCGALDGKHIRIKNFPKTGSENYNYKHHYSILLLISADATYKITYCDIGACGSGSDIGVLENSHFGKAIIAGELPMPQNRNLPGSDLTLPFVFIGDGGFPLKKNLMRPYPMYVNLCNARKAFNYRLSRARRIAENTFGILVARFRIFHKEIEAGPILATLITKGAIVLHNYLMQHSNLFDLSPDTELNGELILGNWREENANAIGYSAATQIGSNNHSRAAEEIRQQFSNYFVSPENTLPWQNNHVNRGG